MTNHEIVMEILGLTEEDFHPSEIKTDELAMTAYVNSELALALIEETEEI